MNDQLPSSIMELVPEGLTPRPGSRQESKSSEMRETILEATLDCLADHGYANTTNSLVCEQAGISRGAMLHHYRTRQDLIVATIEYAFYKHLSNFSHLVASLGEADRMNRNSAIAIDWHLCLTREYKAYQELQMASRTSAELRKVFQPRARHHDLVWKEELLKVFPEWREDMRKLELSRRFVRSLLDGMSLNREQWKDPSIEWILLGFVARLMKLVRTDDLEFPEEAELEAFKNAAMTLLPKRTRRTSSPRKPRQ
ncbi:TetR/AcrR family transcriptional regulator [Halopseudomonas bauzanensis]|uniref:TetR/AcrR family transcriptional regulator n=1 Tax=Halopseudomonas bauzanensis TaxID=653930 RepID=A0A4U0YJB9_9GAMM|nr:TetR/AcrR family transcriptional regulator [Halopseudomonas bauzanensis]TKA92202.1 TetR/AcrR family transcriptional regulator [Halopseudomonas bauzanensis]